VSMILSVALLGIAMKAIPVGTAYAVWTGIGVMGTTLVGMYWLNDEPISIVRCTFIMLILVGVIGLKVTA